MLMTAGAGGVNFTMRRACHLIHWSPSYNATDMRQVNARLLRLRQAKNVTILILYHSNTLYC